MESYRGQEEFEEQLLKDVRTLKTHKLLVEISDITGIKGEYVEIIARSMLRFAYRERDSDVKRIGKENTRLRSWLRQAQRKNSTHDTSLDKEIESELKIPIKNVSEQRKTLNNKKRGKNLIKEIVLPTKADQAPVYIKSRDQGTISRDMLFYDILSRYSETEVVAAIKQLGTVHRIRIKKHFKYQSVRADISLLECYEASFLKGVWKEKILIGTDEKK
ncbi:unnamed protein product [Rhizophagus irregularis]|nr:unnamed protein product [Rhizophagus irregularis]